MVTLDDLYEEANVFLWDNYRLALMIPIDVEGAEEYPEAEGWFEHTSKRAVRICITETAMDFGDEEVIYDILRHELVHYALFMRGKPFLDGCKTFESELIRLGIGSTGTTMLGRYHMYQCEKCGEDIPHYQKVSEVEQSKLRTMCCESTFRYKNEQAVYDGKRRIY
ncbi:MAG: hypothetical protein LC650_05455 [Actinobacteria bacterium]|nr:hypothetical protein [Actinomycetota bacterium]